MTLSLIDTHAHLDGPEYAQDLQETIARAREAGVRAIVSAGQDQTSSRATLELAARFSAIVPAVGVHPHCAKDSDLSWLPSMLDDSRVTAAGEMGLDYHYDFSPRELQRKVFAEQLEMAQSHGLPAIIHCREAYDDVMHILARHRTRSTPVVIHCFTESFDVGKKLIENYDAYLGIGGAVTFKNATVLADAARRLPLERLVLETDCPYMTPVPHRGKRNEPAYLGLVCQTLASLRNIAPEELAAATTANALRLFPKLARVVATNVV